MPMFDARSAFDHVSLVNDANRLSSFLVVAGTFGDQQHLPARMDMQIQLCTGAIVAFASTWICGKRSRPNLQRNRLYSNFPKTQIDLNSQRARCPDVAIQELWISLSLGQWSEPLAGETRLDPADSSVTGGQDYPAWGCLHPYQSIVDVSPPCGGKCRH